MKDTTFSKNIEHKPEYQVFHTLLASLWTSIGHTKEHERHMKGKKRYFDDPEKSTRVCVSIYIYIYIYIFQ